MNRRQFCTRLLGGAAGYVLASVSPVCRGAEAKRPNFIFLFADDLGWGDLGCYGNGRIRTPNLDRLARQGTLFTQFYVSGSVCSPSRTAIMTGQFPARHGVHGHFARPEINERRGMPHWLDPKAPLLTRLLQQAGYVTGHYGKWHLGSGEGAPEPGAYGISEYRTNTSNDPKAGQEFNLWRADLRPVASKLTVDETIGFIERHKDEPFYVNTWFVDPHATLNPSKEQMEPYRRLGPPGVEHKGATQIYFATVTEMDRQIGRLLDRLEELGLAGNTILVFSSDNGPEDMQIGNASHSAAGSAGPFRGRKRSLYEGGVRMPLIVRWPGHTPAGRVDTESVIGGVDLLPTFCSLAGVDLPEGLDLDGEVMSGAFKGRSVSRSKPLMWEWRYRIFGHILHHSPMLAIREGKWKLLMNPDRSRLELYDIPADPSEMNNLAAEQPEVVRRLSEKVLAWQKTLPRTPYDRDAGTAVWNWPREK